MAWSAARRVPGTPRGRHASSMADSVTREARAYILWRRPKATRGATRGRTQDRRARARGGSGRATGSSRSASPARPAPGPRRGRGARPPRASSPRPRASCRRARPGRCRAPRGIAQAARLASGRVVVRPGPVREPESGKVHSDGGAAGGGGGQDLLPARRRGQVAVDEDDGVSAPRRLAGPPAHAVDDGVALTGSGRRNLQEGPGQDASSQAAAALSWKRSP